jgi:hypothetical protein
MRVMPCITLTVGLSPLRKGRINALIIAITAPIAVNMKIR